MISLDINNIKSNNINNLTCSLPFDKTLAIAGLSGSGKSTFCRAIADESLKRTVLLLPKSEYKFLFSNVLHSNFSTQNIKNLPMVFYLGKSTFGTNPRSTLGTHTKIFKEIRDKFATYFDKPSEFFSFNNSIMWCLKCKGRGYIGKYMCPDCVGTRYSKDLNNKKYSLKIYNKYFSIIDINSMSIFEIQKYEDELNISDSSKKVIQNLINMNIGYLTLDRVFSTLSGGETVRVLLAEFLANCENLLIIIDEISIGLDTESLYNILREIKKICTSNQIWFIDHSDYVLNSSEKQIFFGPKSGLEGGKIVAKSPRPDPIFTDINNEEVKKYYDFYDLKCRNISIDKLFIPYNRITSITGESGCGKSTLINECIIPFISKKHKNIIPVLVGQDRNQSITSKSTIMTFLDIKKIVDKLNLNTYNRQLLDILPKISTNKIDYKKVSMLINLGLGYLTLDRKIQTLSTGEFQCVHLVSKLFEDRNLDSDMLFIFDEPSKGLSQNILNLFMATLQQITKEEKVTIFIIEHNKYILSCSDYIIDFGKRSPLVEHLEVKSNFDWKNEEKNKTVQNLIIKSSLLSGSSFGIKNIENDEADNLYSYYEKIFKTVLKSYSDTAKWIYKDYSSDCLKPLVTIDLEGTLYSKNTFLFEIGGIVNDLIKLSNTDNVDNFDFYSKDNLCECCNGKGIIDTFDFNRVVDNFKCGLWDGLLKGNVMQALKKYNYDKIKFLFNNIKKSVKLDLSKPFEIMSNEEKKVFLYGYWKESFYDKKKQTQRKWYGLIHLILKYMRSSESELKEFIKDSKHEITCPICNGSILNHSTPLFVCNEDIRNIITKNIDRKYFTDSISKIDELLNILHLNVKLNADVSTFDRITQVKLKIFEIMYSYLFKYTIVILNSKPFINDIKKYIEVISKNNDVILLDYPDINETKEYLLKNELSKVHIKPNSYVYEIFGYNKISTEINKIKKENKCSYCNGSGFLKDESIFDGVDVTKTPCNFCKQTGIAERAFDKRVFEFTVGQWIIGTVKDFNITANSTIENLKMFAKISELNKYQIYKIIDFLRNSK